MNQVTLNIPDNEIDFFMKLIEKFNYDAVVNDFSFSQEIKDLLDERKRTSKDEDFISWEIAKKQLSFQSVR